MSPPGLCATVAIDGRYLYDHPSTEIVAGDLDSHFKYETL